MAVVSHTSLSLSQTCMMGMQSSHFHHSTTSVNSTIGRRLVGEGDLKGALKSLAFQLTTEVIVNVCKPGTRLTQAAKARAVDSERLHLRL